MKVTVEYSAFLRQKSQLDSEEIEVHSSCTVQELLLQLAQKHGEEFQQILLDENQNLKPVFLVSVNDQQVHWQDNPTLSEGDQLTLLSPIAGGSC